MSKIHVPKRHFTVPEFAAKKGVHPHTVRKWIERGHLRAERVDVYGVTRVLISYSAARAFSHPRTGRPRNYFKNRKKSA